MDQGFEGRINLKKNPKEPEQTSPMLRGSACGNCLYFWQKAVESDIGECRINPPTIVDSFAEDCKNDGDNDERIHYMTRWPVVSFDTWCGRYRAAS